MKKIKDILNKSYIQNLNEKYANSSNKEKKEIICREALNLIEIGSLVNYFTTYVTLLDEETTSSGPLKKMNISTQDFILEGNKCHVCAIGALHVANIFINNDENGYFTESIKANQIAYKSPFYYDELIFIEAIFENYSLHQKTPLEISHFELEGAVDKFRKQCANKVILMKRIFEILLENDCDVTKLAKHIIENYA